MAALHHGIIKSVVSGDSVIVMGVDASRGPPPEKLLSLTGLAAPRLGNKSTADQPYAWEAREFLRRQAIGKRVTFEVESQGTANRAFGSVYFEDGSSLATLMVSNGWAKPRPGGPAELAEAAAAAEVAGLGVYNTAGAHAAVRDVQWAGTFDTASLLQQVKGTPQDAVIEQVPNGSSVRVLLLQSFHQVTLMLAGIQCGGFRRAEDGTEQAAPFAREARYFVETRLLNRDVQVVLEGIDKNGTLLGTVHHPQGNISIELVKVGLAKVVDWSAQMCAHGPQLRGAEKGAKERRLRLWKDYVPPNFGGDMAEYLGKVVEIVSGDTIIVVDGSDVERRVSLSSIRAPRMGRDPEPYAAESKEGLRKALIGKKVKVVPEYKRTFPQAEGGAATERIFAAVTYNNERNVAVLQVAEGLASVSRHGQADERSVHYEALLEAEAAAQASKKGVHAGGDPPKTNVTDLTAPDARDRAKRFLSTLQRHPRIRAIVQFVPNGTRFKMLIPKDNLQISFACVGVRCPQCSRRGEKDSGEPFGDAALAFARNLCFQRDVEIEVETVDKNGTFLGNLFLADKRNYAPLLLEAGLAKVVQPAADRSSCGAELTAAEAVAKDAGLKVWENYSAEEEAAAKASAAAAALAEVEPVPDAQKQVVTLEITEIKDGAHFYAQVAGDTAVAALQEQLAENCKKASGEGFEPKTGQMCCALFEGDWYRAKVTARTASEFTVFFLDYGNTDVVTRDRLKPLDPTLGPKDISPQALECRLAYLKASPATDGADGEEAAHAFGAAAWGKPILARVEERSGDVLLVTLVDDQKTNVNETLVSEGLLRVEKGSTKRSAPLIRLLQEKEQEAKNARLGIWRYGDVDDDDDAPEFGFRRPAAPPSAGGAPNAWGKK